MRKRTGGPDSHMLSGRKVIVTGASGFIGSHLVGRLRELGAEIDAVARTPSPHPGGVRWRPIDLTEPAEVHELIRSSRADFIFHLAGHVTGARDLSLVMPTFRSNLVSTVNLLSAAAETGCRRMIVAGSLEEPDLHGEAVPCSPYAAAKWAGSGYAKMFYELYRFPVVIARLFMVYGPGQLDARKLIPYVTLSLLRGEAPKLSSGTREVDWIYIDDVVEGLVLVACAPDAEGKSFDIGSGTSVSIRHVAERLAQLIHPGITPQFGALPDRPFERVRIAETAEWSQSLGWQPSVSLDDGLRRTVRWYAAQGSACWTDEPAAAVQERDIGVYDSRRR